MAERNRGGSNDPRRNRVSEEHRDPQLPWVRRQREQQIRERILSQTEEGRYSEDDIVIEGDTIDSLSGRISEEAQLRELKRDVAEDAGEGYTPSDVIVEQGEDGLTGHISDEAQRRELRKEVANDAGSGVSPDDVVIEEGQDGFSARISEEAQRRELREDILSDADGGFSKSDVVIESTSDGLQGRISEDAVRRELAEDVLQDAGGDFTTSDVIIEETDEGLSARISDSAIEDELESDIRSQVSSELGVPSSDLSIYFEVPSENHGYSVDSDLDIPVEGSHVSQAGVVIHQGAKRDLAEEQAVENIDAITDTSQVDTDWDPWEREAAVSLTDEGLEQTYVANNPALDSTSQVSVSEGSVELTSEGVEAVEEYQQGQDALAVLEASVKSGHGGIKHSLDTGYSPDDLTVKETAVGSQVVPTEEAIAEQTVAANPALDDPDQVDVTGYQDEISIDTPAGTISGTPSSFGSVPGYNSAGIADVEDYAQNEAIDYRLRPTTELTPEGEGAVKDYAREQAAEEYDSFDAGDFRVSVNDDGSYNARVSDLALRETAGERSEQFDQTDFRVVETPEGRATEVTDTALTEMAAEQSETFDSGDYRIAETDDGRIAEVPRGVITEKVESQVDGEVVGFEQTSEGELDPIVEGDLTGERVRLSEIQDIDTDTSEIEINEQEQSTGVGLETRSTAINYDGSASGNVLSDAVSDPLGTIESIGETAYDTQSEQVDDRFTGALAVAGGAIAAPEPVSTTGGLALAGVIGLATAGSVAYQELGKDSEVEVPDRGTSVGTSEIEVGQDADLSQSEIAVPNQRQRSEVPVPSQPVQETGEMSIPSGLGNTDITIAQTQQLIGQQIPEETNREVSEEDILSREEVILDESERQQQIREELERRQEQFSQSGTEREFPTGAEAVVGLGTSVAEGAEEAVERAQRSEVQQSEETFVGQGQAPIQPELPFSQDDQANRGSAGQASDSISLEQIQHPSVEQPGFEIGLSDQPGLETGQFTEPGVQTQPGVRLGTLAEPVAETGTATGTQQALEIATGTPSMPELGEEVGYGSPSEYNNPTETGPPESPGRGQPRPPRLRSPNQDFENGASDQDPIRGSPTEGDSELAPGWLSETFTTIATGGETPRSPSQSELEEQPLGSRLTGELPTAEMLSDDSETRERIEEVEGLFGGGASIDLGLDFEGGG